MSDFDEAYDRLISWSEALTRTAKESREQIRRVYDGEIKPSGGCPSAASLVGTILYGVSGKVTEVNGAVEDVIQAVAKHRP